MSSLSIVVKRLYLESAEDAAKLHHTTWHETYPGLLPQKMLDLVTIDRNLALWQKAIQDPSFLHLGAFAGTRLLGLGTAGKPRLDLGFDREIWSMNVPSGNQRLGVGKAILLALLDGLKKEGSKTVYLTCIDKNYRALEFYKAMGGSPSHDLVQRDGYQEVLFSWHLQ